jgi:hypothetical protein
MNASSTTFFQKRRAWFEAFLLILIAGLVYLPNVFHFTFYRDDWYYMYDGIVLGPRGFMAMFEHLRPLRGPLFMGLFALFGPNPLPYHLLLFVWRVIGGFGMFWLLRLLWPGDRQRATAFWASVLFTIYPGFLWWVGGFEYQPMVLSLGFQIFSIAFMLKAILAEKRKSKILWMTASIVTIWVYLGLVDYSIGMEFFRVLCAFILVSRGDALNGFKAMLRRLWDAVRVSAPAFLGPIVFLLWRTFFFENWRKATNLGFQLSVLSNLPQTLLAWIIRLLESAADVLFMAWTVPLYARFDLGELSQLVAELALAATLVALVLVSSRIFARTSGLDAAPDEPRLRWEAVSIGLLGVLGGLVPIVVANRFVSFEQFSHYTLPASIAATVFLFGMIQFLSDARLRVALIALLMVSAGLTHFILSAGVAAEARVLSTFWQQVSWRVPGLRPGTTLIVKYPGVNYAESSDLVWGPANIIYYPNSQPGAPIRIPISAARMEGELISDVISGKVETQNYIIINVFKFDYSNALVISQPTATSCVHVIDARWPTLTLYEDPTIRAVAGYSKVEAVQSAGSSPAPPAQLFGPEPTRGWCYYYERADLARQTGGWEQVSALGAEAAQKGFAPAEPLEWIPFLQAQVILADRSGMERIAELLKGNDLFTENKDYYKNQICTSLAALDTQGVATNAEMRALASNLFCK